MSYHYSLYIWELQTDDNEACLAEIKAVAPGIAEYMCILPSGIVFDPIDNFQAWNDEEELLVPIIEARIRKGTVCHIDYTAEDGDAGGYIIGVNKSYPVTYVKVAEMPGGIYLPIEHVEAILLAGTDQGDAQ